MQFLKQNTASAYRNHAYPFFSYRCNILFSNQWYQSFYHETDFSQK